MSERERLVAILMGAIGTSERSCGFGKGDIEYMADYLHSHGVIVLRKCRTRICRRKVFPSREEAEKALEEMKSEN